MFDADKSMSEQRSSRQDIKRFQFEPRSYLFFILVGLTGHFVILSATFSIFTPENRRQVFIALWLLTYLWGAIIFVRYLRKKPYLGLVSGTWARVILISLCILTASSALWSELPAQKVFFSFSLAATIFCGFVLSETVDVGKYLDYLLIVLNISVLLGLVAYIAGAEFAIYQDALERDNVFETVAMTGLFPHKNISASMSLICLLLNITWSRSHLIVRTTFSIISTLAIMLSSSAGGLGLLFLSCFSLFAILMFRYAPRTSRVALFWIFNLLASIATYIGLDWVLQTLGRDENLTGRTVIWSAGREMFYERPLLGWGYQGIITPEHSGPFFSFYYGSLYLPPHLHNSYLQFLVETGVLGTLLFAVVLVANMFNYVYAALVYSNRAALAMALICLVSAAQGMFEVVYSANSFGLALNAFALCAWPFFRSSINRL